ncbi:MAG: DUF881 domain-containing protein [Candidatus Peregrinibacteria bacterium]|nr:DUF881 domain-containing protein [Candidatus Peregrinibacteria bacterium]
MMKRRREVLNITLAFVGVAVGILIAVQIRSYGNVTVLISRDTDTTDLFQEIYNLKTANESLNEEILTLEEQLAQYTDQASAYDTVVAEIEKNEILLGRKPIFGPGIVLSVDGPLTVEWMVDLTNELWAAGAEAISIQNIRLTNDTDGFYAINDWILLDGTVIEQPYTFSAIGDGKVMTNILNQPGSSLTRLQIDYSGSITLETAEIEMEAL